MDHLMEVIVGPIGAILSSKGSQSKDALWQKLNRHLDDFALSVRMRTCLKNANVRRPRLEAARSAFLTKRACSAARISALDRSPDRSGAFLFGAY
jgi:hypothetical protein